LKSQIVVYGGTAAGVAAAIAAARSGCEAVLIERGDHLGGMVASGLGLIDSLRNNAFGGICRDLIANARRYYSDKYGPDSTELKLTYGGLFMEAHVAERLLDRMIRDEPGVTLLKRHELLQAQTEGHRLVGSTYLNRDTGEEVRFAHSVAIDTTYEGDLAAAAGAAYRVGREGRREFGERFAGEVFFDPRYYKQEIHPGSTGEPSPFIQANCFRLTLSDARDRVPIERPEMYGDVYPRFRFLLDDYDRGRIRHLNETLWLNPLANHKYCLNGHIEALTSVNVAELSAQWAEGSWSTRESLYRYYKAHTLGLLHFLQHDSKVPLVPQADASRFGLPADEYEHDAHFPWQLYVRQGRRIVGEYTVTEHDAVPESERDRPSIHGDAIAVYEHGFDSHPCRDRASSGAIVRASDGFELLEGVIYFKSKYKAVNRPATLPYRAIVPEKVDGLLVPAALSATSVAYSAIRMEPVWMAAAEAAGRAASQALSEGVDVRNIDTCRLQKTLLKAGQVLVYFPELALDDPDFAPIQLQALESDHPDFNLEGLRA